MFPLIFSRFSLNIEIHCDFSQKEIVPDTRYNLNSNMMKKETLRLSNSNSMSERLYDVCKSGWMTKRSQNKKRFTPINYKLRWFELTKQFLYYFDVENVEVRSMQCMSLFLVSSVPRNINIIVCSECVGSVVSISIVGKIVVHFHVHHIISGFIGLIGI